jgi:hypothetical protein
MIFAFGGTSLRLSHPDMVGSVKGYFGIAGKFFTWLLSLPQEGVGVGIATVDQSDIRGLGTDRK